MNMSKLLSNIKDWIFYKFFYKSFDEIDYYIMRQLLKFHNLSLEKLKENPKINGIDWYIYYTWTTNDEKKFNQRMTKYMKLHTHMSDKFIKSKLAWFNLMYGYRTLNE